MHNCTSVSNMPQISRGIKMKNNSDYVWDMYETTPIMSTYTIGMAVLSTNYTYNVKQLEKRNVSVISMHYDDVTQERMLKNTDINLRFYENYYNDTDAVPKVDNLHSIGGRYAAMENWGLIIYFTHYNDDLTIAHEVAHYWHGNKVTCSNWDE